ncbi:MAG: prephenate dehydrogenase/arogenate dehydrogenase family protein [Candidatus Nitrotoga sp.]|nr:prephenate dehydrogenase/arogenate dehydrogenase family protein [Candidatus Nitrotoga sp.]MBP0122920.1 prephenate dehydrogenase/arogenate dehydrogenase family protein [Candidatus Nitrotoga sp.]MBP0125620.1 prephenate dehydrogenase/arogenate dehydrogenase family protein [Candidatus Nitrotoga sp.]
MAKPLFQKVVIFGVGLIGGSLSLALRSKHAVGEVVGFGRSLQTLAQAQQLGIIDRSGSDLATELGDADLVFLATPVGQMPEIMARIAPYLGTHTVVMDGGSTKCDVVGYAYKHLAESVAHFVPAHPIAGGEKSGATAARADLYQNKKVVITPMPENSAATIARIREAWEVCGASVSELTPKQHDEVFAAVSHLPHLLSFALVHGLVKRENHDLLLSFAASGFRDFTRIAASSPEMWRDICLANRDTLLVEMGRYEEELSALRNALSEADGERLGEIFSVAHAARSKWTP